jgi:methionyl aminopeptidase
MSIVILKTPNEIKKLNEAASIVLSFLAGLKDVIKPGITTSYLNDLAIEHCEKYKVKPGFLGYKGYPDVLCCSINNEILHGLPSLAPIKNGSILSVDFGIIKDGYYGDSATTYAIGEVPEELQKLIRVTEECFYKGMEQALPGNKLGDVENAIQNHAELNGFNVVRDFVGHSIGLALHEPPKIRNYGKKGSGILLKENMVLCIEPMLIAGNSQVYCSNGWTVKTVDSSLGSHFERTIVIEKDGPKILGIN